MFFKAINPAFRPFSFTQEAWLAMAGWWVFMVVASLYCVLYNQWVQLTPAGFMASLVWSLREYAGGWVVTPLVLYGLRWLHGRSSQQALRPLQKVLGYVILGVGGVCLSFGVAALFSREPVVFSLAHWVDVLPRHVRVLCWVVLVWHVCFRMGAMAPAAAESSCTRKHEPLLARLTDSVRVMKGNGEAIIQWAAVDYISAAGNYMELHCGNTQYLLRMPMKELETLLPSHCFVRVHRSHIVNLEAIVHIGAQPAGNGFIELRHQQRVPLSKAYKGQLERLAPKPSVT